MSARHDYPFEPAIAPPNDVRGPNNAAVAYLAGPMRGYPQQNFPAFFAAALRLRKAGWEIENPAEYDSAAGVDPSADPSEWPITIEQMLMVDFDIIIRRAKAIILLPGWQDSVGAKMELAIALHIGLPAFALLGDKLLRIVFNEGLPKVQIGDVTYE